MEQLIQMSVEMTERDKRVLQSVAKLLKLGSTTYPEIAADTGMSLSMVHNTVGRLELMGWVTRKPGVHRSLAMARKLPKKLAA